MADEYIRKQDAVEALDGKIIVTGHKNADTVLQYMKDISNKIKSLKPADVAPVVRCRDCDCHGTCTHEQYLGMDGFCSHGERKNDVPTNIIESLKEEINTVNRLNDRIKNRGNNG